MQIKIKNHKLMVTADHGFAVYDIEGFFESDKEMPEMIFTEFGKKTYGLDVVNSQDEDFAFFGNLEGDVKAISLNDLQLKSEYSVHEGKDPRSSFIGAINDSVFYSSNHK